MKERNNKMELLGSAPVPKALMALGIPIMIGMLINALYNLVDAYFVGGLGESPMGAISIVRQTTGASKSRCLPAVCCWAPWAAPPWAGPGPGCPSW